MMISSIVDSPEKYGKATLQEIAIFQSRRWIFMNSSIDCGSSYRTMALLMRHLTLD